MSLRELSEEQIHKQVVAELRVRAKPDVVFWHTPNDAKRTPGNANRLKAMGMVPGVPDLILCRNGETFFLEIKSAKGRLSDNQEHFHARLAATGFNVAVQHSVEACTWFLKYSD